MPVPDKYKKEIVLSIRYKRVGNEWKHATNEPGVLRIANRDCSRDFCDPVLVGNLANGFVEVRIYDDDAIDITDAFIADYNSKNPVTAATPR